ncbi:MAG: IS4 family transposase [Acidobacteriota bacterium]
MDVKSIHAQPPLEWAEKHFGDLELGDVRRNQRAVTISSAMAANPDKSIPQLFMHTYDVKAAYNFLSNDDVTPDTIQETHRHLIAKEMAKPSRYLLLEDTTEMSWSGNQPIEGLGPIGAGTKGLQGFHLHSVLSVRCQVGPTQGEQSSTRQAVEVLGLIDQQYHLREPRPDWEKKKKDTRVAKERERESQLWEQAGERIGPAPEMPVEWIRVCDRGADIYEMMISCQQLGHRYVIRAAQDRCLTNEGGRETTGKLMETAREQKELGSFKMELRERRGQPSRTALMKISAVGVLVRSPQRPGKGAGYLAPVKCSLVRVWEENEPEGVEKLEWFLLTDLEVENFSQGLEIALIYSTRWLIEEFHKAVKSGTKAEQLQLERAEGLMAAIAIKSIVALRLIELKERVRIEPEAKAEESGLSELELEILRNKLKRPIKTVRDVALAIGRLGGHLNRKGDGMPGWQTLFRGMSKLKDLVEGVRLALKLKKFG